MQQTLTKGLIELNWKCYVCTAVTAAVTTTVILATQSQGSICPLDPFLFSAKTMTNPKTLHEVCESLLFCMFLKLQALSALKNSEDWEKPLRCQCHFIHSILFQTETGQLDFFNVLNFP